MILRVISTEMINFTFATKKNIQCHLLYNYGDHKWS